MRDRRSDLSLPRIYLAAVSLVLAGTSSCALLSGPAAPAEEPGGAEPSGSSSDQTEGEPVPVALGCPPEPTEYILFVTHTFNWSANRDTQHFFIEGSTAASSPCPLTIERADVTAAECRVPYSNSGTIVTDAGPCHQSGEGFAIVEVEGSCTDGVVTLTIIESVDPDSAQGASLSCPGVAPYPYLTYYPASHTTGLFTIASGGDDFTESVDPDLSGQFAYNKHWSLRTGSFVSP